MSKHIDSTDAKRTTLSRKNYPGDHTITKENNHFMNDLLSKKYVLDKQVTSYTLGKVYLESNHEKVLFRVFRDSEMNIPMHFQKKLQFTHVDDDVQTTSSQVKQACRQNQRDIIKRIYEKEHFTHTPNKNLEEMEHSLFYFSQQQSEHKEIKLDSKQFYSQQVPKITDIETKQINNQTQ